MILNLIKVGVALLILPSIVCTTIVLGVACQVVGIKEKNK